MQDIHVNRCTTITLDILFLKMHGCNEFYIGGGIWYMHKLIIASSTTLQISAKLHKLLPLTSTSHRSYATCDVGETNASSYQFMEQIICMHVQYFIRLE